MKKIFDILYKLLFAIFKRIHILPDKVYLRLAYRSVFGKKLNLDNPQSFNEKIQWLKLYDRNPNYSFMVDKYEVKKFVEDIIGKEYIIPTIGIYDSWDEIDFNNLPTQFVIKCTHDSGGIVICKDKTEFDIKESRKKIEKCLHSNFYYYGREWPYKNVKPRIIIEKFMEDKEKKELVDYKFFVFNGHCKLMFIATDRQAKTDTCFDFYDENFNHLPFTNGHPNSKKKIKKPANFEKMIDLSEKIAKKIGCPQVRIDFYNINGKIYFGEITFSHWSGLVPFVPEKWDYKFGKMIDLKDVRK